MRLAGTAWLMAAWLMGSLAVDGRFVPPQDGSDAFRRDRLPIDAATMSDLSRRLVAMARAQPMETPAQRRDVACMLGLAVALDPQNAEAGKLIDFYQNHPQPQQATGGIAAAEIEPVWRTIAWLESPDAGADGRTLAALLRDAAAAAAPDDERAKAKAGAASAAWNGWIPPLAAYETPAATPQREPAGETVPPAPAPAAGPALASVSLRTVIWQRVIEENRRIRKPVVVSLQMTAILHEENDGDEPSHTPLRIGHGLTDTVTRRVGDLLAARGKSIPDDWKVRIIWPEEGQPETKIRSQPVSAAAAVLASAAITGREPDALVIGEVDPSGRFSLPWDFWKILRALEPDQGRRLILPVEAMDWLPSLLAMDQAAFFFDHEVLLAKNFDELLALSAKSPSDEIAKVCAQYADIRTRGQQGNVRDYLANRFVRQRLAELSQQAPWHASAKLLHIQSAGQRPVTLTRAAVASELRTAILPLKVIADVMKREYQEEVFTAAELKSLGEIHDRCRERIDRLANLVERVDQDLFLAARSVTAGLRTLDRSTRTRGEDLEVQEIVRRQLREFATAFEALDGSLATEENKGISQD